MDFKTHIGAIETAVEQLHAAAAATAATLVFPDKIEADMQLQTKLQASARGRSALEPV
jgi:hypothetical protein